MFCEIHRRCGQGKGRQQVVFCCSARDEPRVFGLREQRERKRSVGSISCFLATVELAIDQGQTPPAPQRKIIINPDLIKRIVPQKAIPF